MRVLMVIGKLLVGGAECAALELVRALEGGRWHFIVAAIRGGDEQLGRDFRDAGAEVCQRIRRFKYDPLGPLRLANIIRRHSVEAVVVVDVPRDGLFYSALAALLNRRRTARVCWCHAVPGGQGGNFERALRRYERLGLLDKIVCVSQVQREQLVSRGLPRGVTAVIPNGIDLGRFAQPERTELPLPADKRIIVQVANVMPDKDHATLIEAAGLLARLRNDFHLVLVGRDTDAPAVCRAVERAGIDRRCTLAGYRPDVPGILAASDIFVLSTKRESFGIAVVEAMAAGLPAVVADLPVFDDVVTDGRQGLRFPVGDAGALSKAIASLLDDRALRDRMAAAAVRQAAHFRATEMAEKFGRLLNALRPGDGQA